MADYIVIGDNAERNQGELRILIRRLVEASDSYNSFKRKAMRAKAGDDWSAFAAFLNLTDADATKNGFANKEALAQEMFTLLAAADAEINSTALTTLLGRLG